MIKYRLKDPDWSEMSEAVQEGRVMAHLNHFGDVAGITAETIVAKMTCYNSTVEQIEIVLKRLAENGCVETVE